MVWQFSQYKSPVTSVHKFMFLAWRWGRAAFYITRKAWLSVISGFRHGVNEIFALLRCYAAFIGSLLPTFRDNLLVPSSRVKGMILEDGTYRLSQNLHYIPGEQRSHDCIVYWMSWILEAVVMGTPVIPEDCDKEWGNPASYKCVVKEETMLK
jgi:hypothetical protein